MLKRITVILLMVFLLSGIAFAQTGRDVRARDLWVGKDAYFYGYLDIHVFGNDLDAFTLNYAGTGHNIFDFQADGVSVLTLDKSGNLTLAGAFSFTTLDWAGGNVTYVSIGEDIQTYVTAATAGDTLVLGSGVYTITSPIVVDKQLNIVGQGSSGFVTTPVTPSHGTLITSTTAALVGFQINSDNVRISDLSVNLTGAGSTAISTANNLQGIVFLNIDVLTDCTGTSTGFAVLGTDAILRDSTFYSTSSNGIARGVYFYNNSSTTRNAVLDCFNVTGTSLGGATYSYPFAAWNINDANTLTMNLNNVVAVALPGTPIDVGIASTSTTTNNSTVTANNCTFNGADYDAYQTGSNVLNLEGSILKNATVFGTPTYRATLASAALVVSDSITNSGTTINTPSAAQVIDAVGDAILANATTVVLDPDGDYTLTSTPTIADGTEGQVVYITCGNAEANIVTVQDQDTLASSNIQLLNNVSSRTITGKSTISLRFDGTDWIEFGGGGLELEVDANPTTDEEGELAWDSNDDMLEVYDGTASRILATKVKNFSCTILDPDGVQVLMDAVTVFIVEAEMFPHGITLLSVGIKTDVSSTYAVNFEEWTSPNDGAPSTIEAVTTSATLEAEDDGTLTDSAIAAGSIIKADLPTTNISELTVWGTYLINEGD